MICLGYGVPRALQGLDKYFEFIERFCGSSQAENYTQ
jgi:hypothetical protein